jgi:NAD(P) transhydrogenase subunit alpha
MKIFIPSETRAGERRVAMVPDLVGKLTGLGLEVLVQSGAGEASGAPDSAYTAAGATIVADAAKALSDADIVASVRPLTSEVSKKLKSGAVTVSFLAPSTDGDQIRALAAAGVTALSFELVPRISRAQSMDALTSQALCAGYRASLVGAELLPKFFPMLMTAAGTVQPANVVVLGAGVAGLQAIATAKRLGARVSAYDVRPASADEVKSMGATFIQLELEALDGGGGYAKEMTEDRAARQRELLTPHISKADVVITTAAVPGRRAPLLVTADMVRTMKAGSVVVDLAAETGGNVEGSLPGQIVEVAVDGGFIRQWGGQDVPSQLPVHASRLYSANVVALLSLFVKEGAGAPDVEDEIIDGCAVVLRGEIRKEVA